MMRKGNTHIIYKEIWHPPCLAVVNVILPCFWNYGVVVQVLSQEQTIAEMDIQQQHDEHNVDLRTITFGYGLWGPSGLTAKTCYLRDIDKSSISTGTCSCWQNFKTFGGWGIRLSLPGMGGIDNMTNKNISCQAYNGSNGPYVEFIERKQGHNPKMYRFVTRDVEKLTSILRQVT